MSTEDILRSVTYQLMPPDLFLVLIAVLLPFCFKSKIRAYVVWLSLLLVAMSIPAIAKLALLPLRTNQISITFNDSAQPKIDVIVVLGGGVYSDGQDGYWLSSQSTKRGAAAKAIAGITGLPIVISGGNPIADAPSEAETIMNQLVYPQTTIIESDSLNTYENAVNTAIILRKRNWNKVLLVTSESHLRRASALFRAQEIEVAGAIGVSESNLIEPSDFFPSTSAFSLWRRALKEYAGMAWYLLNDQIDLEDLD